MEASLEKLLKTERNLWRGTEQHYSQDTIPSGYSALDKALPAGGWSLGSLTELLLHREGIGELSLLLPALKNVTEKSQWAALINPPYIPYAPALANAGIALDRLLIVDTSNKQGDDKDTLWATEQLLRTGTFSSVICWLKKTSARQQRRLQLAAESGHCWAVAYRHIKAADEHSPAALRITLNTANPDGHSGLQLNIIKARGGAMREVIIKPHHFDQPQGTVWPGATAHKKVDLTKKTDLTMVK